MLFVDADIALQKVQERLLNTGKSWALQNGMNAHCHQVTAFIMKIKSCQTSHQFIKMEQLRCSNMKEQAPS